MKNVILGLLETGMLLYMLLILLSIYSISTRKNELNNCLSQVVEDTLGAYYGNMEAQREAIEEEIRQSLAQRLTSDSRRKIEITACDMKKGILGVRVQETYRLPNGFIRKERVQKVAIVDVEERLEE